MKITDAIDTVKETYRSLNAIANNQGIKRVVNMTTKMFDAISPAVEKPSVVQVARAAFACGKIVLDDAEVWSHDHFDNDEWVEPCTRTVAEIAFSLMKTLPTKRLVKTSDAAAGIMMVDVDGVEFGFMFNARSLSFTSLHVLAHKATAARKIISEHLWRKFGSNSLVLGASQLSSYTDSSMSRHQTFNIDDMHQRMDSEQSTKYADYLSRCLNAGVHRCVMLKGPPGTGKSTMAKTIVSILNLRSFRIKIGDMSESTSNVLYDVISMFKPEALIIDDFDRLSNQTMALDIVEFFKKHVKLVIVSVNNVSRLDDALLRPGRFDEIVNVDRMDEGVVRKVLGEYQDGFEFVKDWPIAFIEEYISRRRFMSAEEAEASMVELAERATTLGRDNSKTWLDLARASNQSFADVPPPQKRKRVEDSLWDDAEINDD